jgi:uroporphyrinogen-III decarboxylase
MQWLYQEIDTFIDAGYSKYLIGFPDLQGPLNIAIRVIGDIRMLGLIAHHGKTSVVEHILEQCSDAYISVTQALRNATGRPKKYPFRVAGCTYFYLSPSQWERFCLPILHKISALGSISLHHCGEANSEKIKSYSKYPWRSAEFGFGSDLKLARQIMHYPKGLPLPFSCRISPYRMLNQSSSQIQQDIAWILQNAKGGPISISCVGVPLNTPEENIWTFYRTIEAYNHRTVREKFFNSKKGL